MNRNNKYTIANIKIKYKKPSLKHTLTIILALTITLSTITLTQTNAKTNQTPNTYDLLIIGPEQYQQTIQKFITHKQTQNITSQYTPIETITTQNTTTQTTQQLHNYITTQYQQSNIKYLLLIGDYTQTPTKYVYSPSNEMQIADFNYKPTDWYYATPNWDYSKIGTLKGNIPQFPVGRLPTKNIQELEQTITKIINTQNQPTTEKFLIITDPSLHPYITLKTPHTHQNLQAETTNTNLTQTLNQNIAYLNTHTHGTPSTLWLETPKNNWTPLITSQNTKNLTSNINIYYITACFTGALDLQEESLAQTLITQPKGPAMVIASSRTETGDNYINTIFWENFFQTGQTGTSFLTALQTYLSDPQVFSDYPSFQKYNFYLTKTLYGDVSWQIENPTQNLSTKTTTLTQNTSTHQEIAPAKENTIFDINNINILIIAPLLTCIIVYIFKTKYQNPNKQKNTIKPQTLTKTQNFSN